MAKVDNVHRTCSSHLNRRLELVNMLQKMALATNAIRHIAKEVLIEITIWGWKTDYLHEIARKTRDNEDSTERCYH